MSYRETVRKHKQIIIIVAAIGAIASYMLPLDNILALTSHNNANANANARAALAHNSKTNPTSGSSNGNSGTGTSATSKKSGDTTFSNGNSAQLGGKADNGNIGRGNTGTGDTGNGNSGNGDTGNGNSANNDLGNNNNAPGQTGDFCGNGKGHHYGCLAHNPH